MAADLVLVLSSLTLSLSRGSDLVLVLPSLSLSLSRGSDLVLVPGRAPPQGFNDRPSACSGH